MENQDTDVKIVVIDNLENLVMEEKKLELVDIESKEFEFAYSELLSAIDRMTELKEKVDGKVKNVLEEIYLSTGKRKVENEKFSISFMPVSFREGFDTKSFKKDSPEVYEKYKKVSQINSSIRIKRKEESK